MESSNWTSRKDARAIVLFRFRMLFESVLVVVVVVVVVVVADTTLDDGKMNQESPSMVVVVMPFAVVFS